MLVDNNHVKITFNIQDAPQLHLLLGKKVSLIDCHSLS